YHKRLHRSRNFSESSMPRICCFPLPLERGRGEGLATKPKILLSPFLSEQTGKRMEESFLFLLLSYTLTPTLSQRERAFTHKFLALEGPKLIDADYREQ